MSMTAGCTVLGAELLLFKRNRLDNRFELSSEVWLTLSQVLSYRFILQKPGEISLCEYQVQHILSVGLLVKFVFPPADCSSPAPSLPSVQASHRSALAASFHLPVAL